MPVGDESQVREGLLRGSDLALGAREEVGEVDEEAAVALTLVRRQSQDAGDVEVLGRTTVYHSVEFRETQCERVCGIISLYHTP